MRNFVIINGVNSNTINGLGINELPPITKPEMRNIREEIDGKDGDIITDLGYSAYDKTITIGLFGTGYDINDIVAFFNGEGTIVFSNEPDKYYNFKILNQIDYESLQKFRTASITFHCQPFKYPLSETPLEIEYDYIEQEDETLTLNNTGNALMKLDLKGNTSQSGEPTPDAPIPVNVVSGDNTIKIEGKNLFKDKYILAPSNENKNAILKAGTYTIATCDNNTFGTNIYFKLFDSNGNIITTGGHLTSTGTQLNFSTSSYSYYGGSGAGKVTFTIDNDYQLNIGLLNSTGTRQVMLVKGTTEDRNYISYQSQSYAVNLGTIELCKIGDYQDYIYKDNKKWYLHKEIGKVTFNGTENWVARAFPDNNYLSLKRTLQVNANGGYCNYFTNNNQYDVVEEHITVSKQWQECAFAILKSRLSTPDSLGFKDWLSTHNAIVYYVLATPYLSLIEDNNLIEQLDNLSNAMSYEGTTNIGQVNNDKPFIISAKALEQGTNEVVINNIGNIYSKPLIALKGNGNVDIYLDNTQILKANVEDKMNIDIAQLEAYNPDTMTLLNRQVIGNYNSMTLQPGNNTIRIDGALTKATITNYVRWL